MSGSGLDLEAIRADMRENYNGGKYGEVLLAEVERLRGGIVAWSEERSYMMEARDAQDEAYFALEAQYMAVSDAHAALVDKVAALAAEAIR